MKYLLLTYFCYLIAQGTSHAQYDPKAQEILNAVSKKYKAYKAFRADFTYTMESASGVKNEMIKGEIYVKGDKFKLNLGDQEIINNGNTVWTYLKKENEVNVSDYEPDESEITPTSIYTVYQKGYKYILLEEKNENGQALEVVDLVPEDKSKKIFKIRIVIAKKDKSIKSWRMFEKSGNRYVYSISKLMPNPPNVDDKFFVFDKTKYAGIEVVDLR